MSTTELLVELEGSSRPANFVLTDTGVVVEEVGEPSKTWKAYCAACLGKTTGSSTRLPFAQILNCFFEPSLDSQKHFLSLAALSSTQAKSGKVLRFRGTLTDDTDVNKAKGWVEEVMKRAYAGVKPFRRLHVVLNPEGGTGSGEKIWRSTVHPIFEAAGCQIDFAVTDKRYHAVDIAEKLDVEKYDVLVPVSGDGLVHELINGLGKRKDGGKALRSISLGCIPAGSANAMVVNLLGPSHSHNPVLAALTVVKGRPLPLDLCSVTQQKTDDSHGVDRTLSFLSIAFGLLADVDVGTEHMRWMGETRFMVGFVEGALANRKQPCRLEIQVIEQDRDRIHEEWKRKRSEMRATAKQGRSVTDDAANGFEWDAENQGLPALRFGDVTTDLSSSPGDAGSWVAIEQDITSMYAGTCPWVASNLLQFPVKLCGDGSVDVAVLDSPGTMRTLACVDNAEKGAVFRNPDVRYFKARAFRLTPLKSKKKSYVTVDGEDFPYRPIQVEVHSALTHVLSMEAALGETGMPEDV